MINKVLPLLSRLIPQNLGLKGLSKIDPRLNKYIDSALVAGYGADTVMDFLRHQFEPISEEGLRPDEAAAQSRVKQSFMLPNAAKTAVRTGLIGAGAGIVPTVIGSLFQGEEETQAMQPQANTPEEQSQSQKNTPVKQPSPLSREGIMGQQGMNLGQIIGKKMIESADQAPFEPQQIMRLFPKATEQDIAEAFSIFEKATQGKTARRQQAQTGPGAERLLQLLQNRPKR